MWVVCKIQDFELEPSPNQRIKLPPIVVEKGKMIGFLPVYKTQEDAHADFPNASLVQIALVSDKEVKRCRA